MESTLKRAMVSWRVDAAIYVRGPCATDATPDNTPCLLLVPRGPPEVSNNILVANPPTEPRDDEPAQQNNRSCMAGCAVMQGITR